MPVAVEVPDVIPEVTSPAKEAEEKLPAGMQPEVAVALETTVPDIIPESRDEVVEADVRVESAQPQVSSGQVPPPP